jgi:hypothetical protein
LAGVTEIFLDQCRAGIGADVRLAGVAAIAFGLDTGLLARVSLASTNGLEQALVDHAHAMTAEPVRIVKQDVPVMKAGPSMMMMATAHQPSVQLHVEGQMPSLAGAVDWLNGPPLTVEQLRGRSPLLAWPPCFTPQPRR